MASPIKFIAPCPVSNLKIYMADNPNITVLVPRLEAGESIEIAMPDGTVNMEWLENFSG
jgi:hypothetical protein